MTSPPPIGFDKYGIYQVYEEDWQGVSKAGQGTGVHKPTFRSSSEPNLLFKFLSESRNAVDDALKSAAEVEKKTSDEADKAFKNAVDKLTDYGRDYSPREAVRVAERMEKAEEEDKSSLKVLNRLKEAFRPLEEEPTTEVEFHLHESLPDKNPTVVTVTQVLGKKSKLSEVLWNFSRYKGNKRLTLKQNPHFYKHLPRKYEDDFQSDPIEIEYFLDALGDSKGDSLDRDRPKLKPKISVLTDREGRIYLESGQGSRAFGNVWCPQNAIIFKDVCGKLEGEKIVGSSIKGQPNLQYCEEPSTSANTMEWKPLQDWTEPIRRLLKSQSPDRDVSNIHIVMEQSGPHKSRKVSPSIPNHRPSGSSNVTKRTGSDDTPPLSESIQPRPVGVVEISSKHGTAQSPLSSAPTQHQPAVTAEISSKLETAQSPLSSAPTQHQPVVTAEIPSKLGTAQSPPPSSAPTQHQPDVTAGNFIEARNRAVTTLINAYSTSASTPTQHQPVTAEISSKLGTAQSPPSSAPTQRQPAVTAGTHSNHKIAQPPPPSSASTTQPLPVTSNHGPTQPPPRPLLPISSPPDRTTPAPVPLTKPIPPSQHHQSPPNVAQERQPQACTFAKEALNISVKVGMASSFTPNVTRAITSHISRDGGNRNVPSHVDPLAFKLEGPTSKAPKPDVTPPPLQTQPQKPAQRPVWQAWFQRVWTGGK
ncbi:hypothetical protein F5888DRAFT_1827814 [Russula emetica]|nr:hypothetical protein F5888DRAFT_1827814 [Russula emetica]